MKTLKDFISKKYEMSVVEEVATENIPLEAVDSVNEIFTETEKQHPLDPPAVLIMRRKSVRQFPNNQRVALYYVDKIDKYVTVPYTAMQWSSTGAMDVEE